MSLIKSIRSLDLFGHSIELNFRKKGSTHNTLIGGLVSILIFTFMAYYVYSLTDIMVSNGKFKTLKNLEMLGSIKLKPLLLSIYNLLLARTSKKWRNMSILELSQLI